LIAGLVAVGLLAAGCGDDDDDGDGGTSSETISKQEWIREADKICARLDRKCERETREFFAGAPAGEEAPPSQIEKFGEQIVYPNLQKQIDQIKALPPSRPGRRPGDRGPRRRAAGPRPARAASRAAGQGGRLDGVREGREARRQVRARQVRERLSR
jgi:hypothetical protein